MNEEPTADGDAGVQRVVATGLGSLMFPATDRVIAACIRDTGVWQPDELDWLKTHVPRGGTCLTIGANVGYFACWMSRLVGPRGRVFAVEPNPRLVPLLRANLAECALPNVDVAPCAAGAADGTATLWISDANSGDSRVFDPRLVETDDDHDANGCGDWRHSVDVPMRAADGIVGDRAVDVVFIDAQGWDHHVLRGLRNTIERCRPVILFEFVPAWIRGLGEDPAMVLAECASWGYRLGSSDVAVEHPATPAAILAAMAAAGQAFVNIEMLPGDPVPTSGRGV